MSFQKMMERKNLQVPKAGPPTGFCPNAVTCVPPLNPIRTAASKSKPDRAGVPRVEFAGIFRDKYAKLAAVRAADWIAVRRPLMEGSDRVTRP